MGHRSIQREIRKIADRAGLSKDVYPHLLRHSFATQGLKSGMSINVIHDLLGHDSLDTTLIYAQTDRDTAAFRIQKAYQPITHIDRYKLRKRFGAFLMQ